MNMNTTNHLNNMEYPILSGDCAEDFMATTVKDNYRVDSAFKLEEEEEQRKWEVMSEEGDRNSNDYR